MAPWAASVKGASPVRFVRQTLMISLSGTKRSGSAPSVQAHGPTVQLHDSKPSELPTRYLSSCCAPKPSPAGYGTTRSSGCLPSDLLPMRKRRGRSGDATARRVPYIHARSRLKGPPGPKRTWTPSPGEQGSKTPLAQAERTLVHGTLLLLPVGTPDHGTGQQ
jgi:hypothetical protein